MAVISYTLDATGADCGDAPPDLTVERAHTLMQRHGRCTTIRCQRRQAALELLVRTGRYQLSPH